MKKTDPLRVARVLTEAFERQPRRVGRNKPNLMEFCEKHGLNYKLTSKWLHKGLAYVHPDSEEALRKLVDALGIKWGDLWGEKDVIEVSPETIANLIQQLDKVKTELLSLAGRVRVNAPRQTSVPVVVVPDLELDTRIHTRIQERVRAKDEVLAQLLTGSDRIPKLNASNASWLRVKMRRMVRASLANGLGLEQAIDAVLDDFKRTGPLPRGNNG